MERAPTVTVIAGEDIDSTSNPIQVFLLPDYDLADGSVKYQNDVAASFQVYGANWIKQNVSGLRNINKISKITLNLLRVGNPSGDITIDIWHYNDEYNGTTDVIGWEYVETANISCSSISDSVATDYDFTFSPADILGSDLMIIVSVIDGDSSNYIEVTTGDEAVISQTSSGDFSTSDDSGANWSGIDDVWLYFDLHGSYSSFDTVNRAYISDFTFATTQVQKRRFTGFAVKGQNVSAGNPIKIQYSGIIDGFSGLNVGAIYYPSKDKAGEISLASIEDGEQQTYFYTRFELLRALTPTRGMIFSNNGVK